MTPLPHPLKTTDAIELPQLKSPLPEELAWLENDIRRLIRPAAFLRSQPVSTTKQPTPAPFGSTYSPVVHTCLGSSVPDVPDVPLDASWAPSPELDQLRYQWAQSPFEGESFYLQLNLAEIPAQIRTQLPAHCPSVGIVWVFIDLTGDWKGIAKFDPRPAEDIAWHPRAETSSVLTVSQWIFDDTLPFATKKTLPYIELNWDTFGEMYDDWLQEHYHAPTDVQIGGWVTPIQGDHDEAQTTFVCSLNNCSFGDAGSIYLHYSDDKGFFVLVETY